MCLYHNANKRSIYLATIYVSQTNLILNDFRNYSRESGNKISNKILLKVHVVSLNIL